jgi:phosphoglycolate phosphatase
MTGRPAHGATLDELIARTRYLLIDFDGPVCDIFAGHPAWTVADRLRKLITGQGITPPEHIQATRDPIEVFAYSATVSPDLAARVEAEMADQELAAVATAKPTPYVHDVITSCRDTGRQVAIVSNNADRAVRAYLGTHGLADRIDIIAARTSSNPALLKPSPYLIEHAMTQLRASADECLLIGDSVTDMEAATRIDVPAIGYANKPGKRERLTMARAEAVVSSLADLVLGLRSRPLPN